MSGTNQAIGLRRVLRTRDLVLFYVCAVLGTRWVAVAAAAGPSALTVWMLTALALFVPLALAVLELSSRYPQEGGLYVWSKHAFGDFAGFLTGWCYWGSNLSYLPGLLYFTAGSALYIFGEQFMYLQDSPAYFVAVSLFGLALAAGLNVVGLDKAKWLNSIGGIATWASLGLLIVLGLYTGLRYGSATPITAASLVPSIDLKEMIFWSTLAFAFTGLESGSFLGDEIENPRRTVPRAVIIGGLAVAALYILGTLAILLALPQDKVTGLGGFMDAMVAINQRLGVPGISQITALLIVISTLGGVSIWLAAPARLPFVAGIDNFLPAAFGKLHPKYGTPHVALWLQAIVAAVCAVLGQAGETPKQAYSILVSLGVISFFLPYLTLFAALIKLQGEPAGPGVMRVPGGKPVAIICGVVGFLVSLASIFLAAIPPQGQPDPERYVIKVVGLSLLLVLSGAITYAIGKANQRRPT